MNAQTNTTPLTAVLGWAMSELDRLSDVTDETVHALLERHGTKFEAQGSLPDNENWTTIRCGNTELLLVRSHEDTGVLVFTRPVDVLTMLQESALEACRFHGHTMGPWCFIQFGPPGHRSAVCGCAVCGQHAQVDECPAAGGADIGGSAVSTGCCGNGPSTV